MRFKKIMAVILISAILLPGTAQNAAALEYPEIGSQAAIIIDPFSGSALFEKKADERMYPASLTKIMTVLLAVEAIDEGRASLDDTVTASQNITTDLIADGSTLGIEPGETLTLEHLMYCALVRSANETCNIIAEHIGGSISNFITMMNDRARTLGCTGTRYTNTYGAPDEGHYTTAWDMAIIASEAINHSLFVDICSTESYQIPATNLYPVPRILKNTNALLGDTESVTGYKYEYACGIKTGWTTDAGHCLVAMAIKDEVTYITVVMGGQTWQRQNGTTGYGHFADTITLFEWAYNNFSFQDILRTSERIAEIPVEMGSNTDKVALRPSHSLNVLLPNDVNMSEFSRDILIFSERSRETLIAPIEKGTVLGEITIKRNGESYGTVPLVAAASVDLSKLVYIQTEVAEDIDSKPVKLIFYVAVALLALYLLLVVRYRVFRLMHKHSLRKAQAQRAAIYGDYPPLETYSYEDEDDEDYGDENDDEDYDEDEEDEEYAHKRRR